MQKKENPKYSSVQIRKNLKDEFTRFCDDKGYKVSGLLERLILTHLSGSKDNSK